MSRRVTARDRSASPDATALTASISSAGPVSFTRKPLAPARSAPNSASSPSDALSTMTRTLSKAGFEKICRVVSRRVRARQVEVDQDDVRELPLGHGEGLPGVACLADDHQVLLGGEERCEGASDESVAVCNRDARL